MWRHTLSTVCDNVKVLFCYKIMASTPVKYCKTGVHIKPSKCTLGFTCTCQCMLSVMQKIIILTNTCILYALRFT